MPPLDYLSRHRRLLLDMHIGDWDPRALAQYDPKTAVDLWHRANVNAAMFYCQSHLGLCYWPTRSGKMHAGLRGRDIVGETLELLHERDIAACGYYSLIFNNWAFLEHPDWRIVPAKYTHETDLKAAFEKEPGRYGTCCPNHPDYRRFSVEQIGELTSAYAFDAFFYDMTFWPRVCVCPQCRKRFREETGREIPETVNWLDPSWCAFQEARDRWLIEFAALMTQTVKQSQDIPVYHNFAAATINWWYAPPLAISEHYDFLSADLYGGGEEGLVAAKMFHNLTRHRPLELMTSRCSTCFEHERTKSMHELRTYSCGVLAESGAMLFIDAVNPEGTLTPAFYDMLGELYRDLAPYEPHLGGRPVEDIAIYLSGESRMSFADNGTELAKLAGGSASPHRKSVEGFSRILSRHHLPFGIITRRQLGELDRFKLVIVPNALRMDRAEADALRDYVQRGGKLLATRYTSLTETSGVRGDDFMLADVFGCHFAGDDVKYVNYLRFDDPALRQCIHPQRYLTHDLNGGLGMIRLKPRAEGEVLGRLTTMGYDEPGTIFNNRWISIHTCPPWEDTQTPALVRNAFGKGRCVYIAADIEGVHAPANDRLLLHLIRELSGDSLSFSAQTHPGVRMTVFDQPERSRYLISLLNAQEAEPVLPVPNVTFQLRPPAGKRFSRMISIPDMAEAPCRIDSRGAIDVTLPSLNLLAMFAAMY
ncbi:MAG: beta-galactosidase trimerization domain-containing protein [Phycisphaeraceae bacterium]|nr:beta-galactosidase trimerization domain-containing protein [Phycisphaeraceae bacterium]